jgi:cell division septum initiation protein DivIVA
MDNLKKSFIGTYKAADVDALLRKVRDDYERCLKEQKDRIIQLREDNREMAQMITKYKSNEQYIIGAITRAEETAEAIISGAEKRARARVEILENEELQLRVAAEGCCQRLYKLKRASEAIYRAVSKVIGDHEETEKTPAQYNIRPVKAFPAAVISDRT